MIVHVWRNGDVTDDGSTMTMGDSNKALYAKMIVDVVLGPILERVHCVYSKSEIAWMKVPLVNLLKIFSDFSYN